MEKRDKAEVTYSDNIFWQLVVVGLVLLPAAYLLCMSAYRVPEGYVGVVDRWGKILPEERVPGIHFMIPVIDVVKGVNIRPRTINYLTGCAIKHRTKTPSSTFQEHPKAGQKPLMDMLAKIATRWHIATKRFFKGPLPVIAEKEKAPAICAGPVQVLDQGVLFDVELMVQYRLKPSLAAETIAAYGDNYEDKLIHPVVYAVVGNVVGDYPAELVLLKRGEIEQRIASGIKSRFTQPASPIVILSVQCSIEKHPGANGTSGGAKKLPYHG